MVTLADNDSYNDNKNGYNTTTTTAAAATTTRATTHVREKGS